MPLTYDPIATTTVTSGTSVNFTSISSAYTDLFLVINGNGTGGVGLQLTFNNDSSSLYSYTRLFGNGTTTSSDRASTRTLIDANIGNFNDRQNVLIHIMNYSNTTTNKTILIRSDNPGSFVGSIVGLYRSTSAINRIDVTLPNPGSYVNANFTLYGIKAA